LTDAELKAQELVEAELAGMMKMIQDLKEMMVKQEAETAEVGIKQADVSTQLKLMEQESDKLEQDFAVLDAENIELESDLAKMNDHCVQDRLSIAAARTKIAGMQDELDVAANPNKNSGENADYNKNSSENAECRTVVCSSRMQNCSMYY
jgi:hypothetical protein